MASEILKFVDFKKNKNLTSWKWNIFLSNKEIYELHINS